MLYGFMPGVCPAQYLWDQRPSSTSPLPALRVPPLPSCALEAPPTPADEHESRAPSQRSQQKGWGAANSPGALESCWVPPNDVARQTPASQVCWMARRAQGAAHAGSWQKCQQRPLCRRPWLPRPSKASSNDLSSSLLLQSLAGRSKRR